MLTRRSVFQFFIFIGVIYSCLVVKDGTQAQVNSDDTVSTKVNINNSDFNITGGKQVGNNLFHSFSEFSVPTRSSVIFDNDLGVQNIFSRVTGNSISNIDGLIKANGTANLFLLNPNGIIFGSNAELNIGGSFIATTAEQINFADGTLFSATDSQSSPLLTVSIPVGLQFGETAKSIITRPVKNGDSTLSLEVQPGKTLAFLGGNIVLDGGNLFASNGKIAIASVVSNSFVGLSLVSESLTLDLEKVQNFQDISLVGETFIENTGGSNTNIIIKGRKITIDQTQLSTVNDEVEGGGNIKIEASESIKISDSSILSSTDSTGSSGDIIINTQKLAVRNGSFIDTSNNSEIEGRGGNLTVNASQLVEIDGSGKLTRLTTETFNNEDAGNLRVTTQRLILRDGGQIKSSTNNFQGNGGSILIEASESIQISGRGIKINGEIVNSGLFSTTEGNIAFGNGGNITIDTNRLSVDDGGTISVAATEGSIGRAGTITINADSLSLNEGSITAETAQTGGEEGAIINIQADLLTLQNESQISATASDSANGGNVEIDANFVIAFPNQNNDIIAKAALGEGGKIDITTSGIFGISERSSTPTNNTNDIDPSSDFGLDGTVNINQLEVNPAEGLESLPTEVIDVARLVAQNLCQQGRGSEFVVTGKGGIASDPSQTRDGNIEQVYLVEPVSEESKGDRYTAIIEKKPEIIEAQGWIVNDRGNVELISNKTSTDSFSSQLKQDRLCP